MNQRTFAQRLRREKWLVACDEVSSYGCIADVLALDTRKEQIVEYEFKKSSYDLKVAEKKKSKYRLQKRRYKNDWTFRTKDGMTVLKEPQRPHKFYFVIPKELFEKEKEYLKGLDKHCGVICLYGENLEVVKKCYPRKTNLQKYDVVVRNILNRLANVYAF